jgi:Na+/proline symporter
MVVFAFYHDCDPISTRQVEKKDQIFPLFVMQVMGDYPGVPGLFVAGVFSGALSTVSSGLNSLAAVCLRDFIQSGCNIHLTETRATFITKMLAVSFGVVGYGVVFLVKYLPGVLEVIRG